MVALRKYSPGRPPLPEGKGRVRAHAQAMPRPAGEEAIVADLQQRISKPGSSKRVAAELGVHRGHLLSIANGNKPLGPKVAAALGYQLAWEKALIEKADAEDRALADKIEAELHLPRPRPVGDDGEPL